MAIDIGCERIAPASDIEFAANPIFTKGIYMCEKNEDPKGDASDESTTPAEAAGVGALLGLAVGTLVVCPAVGIAFAVIWGIQAALCAATGHEVDSNDVS